MHHQTSFSVVVIPPHIKFDIQYRADIAQTSACNVAVVCHNSVLNLFWLLFCLYVIWLSCNGDVGDFVKCI